MPNGLSAAEAEGPGGKPKYYFDVNNDGVFNLLDLLSVIQFLNGVSRRVGGEGESADPRRSIDSSTTAASLAQSVAPLAPLPESNLTSPLTVQTRSRSHVDTAPFDAPVLPRVDSATASETARRDERARSSGNDMDREFDSILDQIAADADSFQSTLPKDELFGRLGR